MLLASLSVVKNIWWSHDGIGLTIQNVNNLEGFPKMTENMECLAPDCFEPFKIFKKYLIWIPSVVIYFVDQKMVQLSTPRMITGHIDVDLLSNSLNPSCRMFHK